MLRCHICMKHRQKASKIHKNNLSNTRNTANVAAPNRAICHITFQPIQANYLNDRQLLVSSQKVH